MDSEKDLVNIFFTPERAKAVAGLLRHRQSAAYGLAGSAAAMLLASIPKRKSPVLAVGDSLDDAGYLYQDLSRLLGEGAVAMLPSGFKRDIKYGQEDAPNRILRNDALGRWHTDTGLRIVVTYPEALAEQVATRQSLEEHTISLRKGGKADMSATEQWLRDNGFVEQDYVYEPGHFAVRGSILDIFGFSSELPYRIDFFDDEIDSIRTFNVETQLSEERLDMVTIAANVDTTADSRGVSLLEFIPDDTLVCLRDERFTIGRIEAIAAESFSESAIVAGEGDAHALLQVVDPEAFAARLSQFRRLAFTAANTAPAETPAAFDFGCVPQGIYHKNFDLISSSFKQLLAEGYRLYILSDSPKQFDRLRAIFADRGDDISFTAMNLTLHEGFVDHNTRTCVFTDHQIFDRFHKYTLRSERARSGKLALSLKELTSIEPGDFIVHIDHGIGRFGGLLRSDVGGRVQEMV